MLAEEHFPQPQGSILSEARKNYHPPNETPLKWTCEPIHSLRETLPKDAQIQQNSAVCVVFVHHLEFLPNFKLTPF